jgi:drug/metabolite transporter (DMT)-like permease
MSLNIDVKTNSFKGFIYALGGTILVSTNFVTAKYGLQGFNPETFSLVWTTAAALYSFIVILISGQFNKVSLSLSSIKSIFLLGLTTGAGMLLGWAGLARLDPSFTAFLWRFQPVLAIIMSIVFLGERFLYKEIIPIFIMIFGSLFSTMGRWNIVGVGTILTLFACIAAALQMLIAKAKVRKIHPNILVFYRVGIGAIIIMLWTFLSGKADFHVEPSYWYITLLGAFLGPCASFLLTFRSYRYWDLSRSSIVRTIQPIFVIPLAYIVFGKLPIMREFIGGSIILIGAFYFAWIHFLKR